MSSIVVVGQATTPLTPTSGKVRVYVGVDGILRSVDSAGTVTIYASGITQEQVEDYVGSLLQDSTSINVTYNDAGNAIAFDVLAGGVDHNALANLTVGDPHTQYLLTANAPATVRATVLTGLSTATSAAVTAPDTILSAIGKLQAQINALGGSAVVVTTADLTSASNVTLSAITPLVFTAVAGKVYLFEYTLRFRSAATGTGIALTLNSPDTAVGSLSAVANIIAADDGTNALYTGSINAYSDIVVSSNVETTNANFIAIIKGVFVCTASGTIQPYFRSETNGTTVTLASASVGIIRTVI